MSDEVELRSQLLAAVRRFVKERLIVSETDAIPAAALAEMRALGLFGLSILQAFGGLGLSMEDECLVSARQSADRHAPCYDTQMFTA